MLHFREYLDKIEEYAIGNTVGVHNDGPGSGFNSGGGMAYVSPEGGGKGFLPKHWSDTDFLLNRTGFLDGIVRQAIDKMDVNQGRLPLTQHDARVIYLRKESNPIYAHLENGTKLFFTRGEWQRCGKPEVGDKINVVLQRRPDDTSKRLSQVQTCRVC